MNTNELEALAIELAEKTTESFLSRLMAAELESKSEPDPEPEPEVKSDPIAKPSKAALRRARKIAEIRRGIASIENTLANARAKGVDAAKLRFIELDLRLANAELVEILAKTK